MEMVSSGPRWGPARGTQDEAGHDKPVAELWEMRASAGAWSCRLNLGAVDAGGLQVQLFLKPCKAVLKGSRLLPVT